MIAGNLLVLTSLSAAHPPSQGVAPLDNREAARFAIVTRAVAQAGFAYPRVLAHGAGASDALFVLLATTVADSSVLLVVAQPDGAKPGKPVALERGRFVELGISGIQFSGFLGSHDLYDIAVGHHPFQLETTRIFDQRYILRARGAALTRACAFDGNATSAYSKGIGSSTWTRRVTVDSLGRTPALSFAVKTVEQTVQREGRDTTAVVSGHTEKTTRYLLGASGTCKEIAP